MIAELFLIGSGATIGYLLSRGKEAPENDTDQRSPVIEINYANGSSLRSLNYDHLNSFEAQFHSGFANFCNVLLSSMNLPEENFRHAVGTAKAILRKRTYGITKPYSSFKARQIVIVNNMVTSSIVSTYNDRRSGNKKRIYSDRLSTASAELCGRLRLEPKYANDALLLISYLPLKIREMFNLIKQVELTLHINEDLQFFRWQRSLDQIEKQLDTLIYEYYSTNKQSPHAAGTA